MRCFLREATSEYFVPFPQEPLSLLPVSGEGEHPERRYILSARDCSAPGIVCSASQTRRLQQRLSRTGIPHQREVAATEVEHPVHISINQKVHLNSSPSHLNSNRCVLFPDKTRVLEQHKLNKNQWEERIQVWHQEHKGMLR